LKNERQTKNKLRFGKRKTTDKRKMKEIRDEKRNEKQKKD